MKMGDNEYKLCDLDAGKDYIIKELKSVENDDLEVLVFRTQLTYSEVENILDMKYVDTSATGYILEPGINETGHNILMVKSFFPQIVKVNITNDDNRLKPNLSIKEIKKFTKKIIFYTVLGFTQSHSGPLGDVESFIQMFPSK